jgi:hypothetical protein
LRGRHALRPVGPVKKGSFSFLPFLPPTYTSHFFFNFVYILKRKDYMFSWADDRIYLKAIILT